MSTIYNLLDKITGALFSFNFTSDLLDILFVTIVIFELIKLIRGSRTFQVIKGIVLLFVVYAAIKLLNMEASEYLFTVLFQNGLLILVVLGVLNIHIRYLLVICTLYHIDAITQSLAIPSQLRVRLLFPNDLHSRKQIRRTLGPRRRYK